MAHENYQCKVFRCIGPRCACPPYLYPPLTTIEMVENALRYEAAYAKMRHEDPNEKIGPFDDMKSIWALTNEQSSRRFLMQFNEDDKPLSMTLFSGGSFYGMTFEDRFKYMRMKANDVDASIVYTDNEFAHGDVRLAFELDLKSVEFMDDWYQNMMDDTAKMITILAKKYGRDARCHCLTRPPYQTKDGTWKYGMHIICPSIIVTTKKGAKITRKFKQVIPHIDSVYDGDVARLRPAFSRKIDRCKKQLTLSYYYDYKASIKFKRGKTHQYVHAFRDTVQMLLQTALTPTPK